MIELSMDSNQQFPAGRTMTLALEGDIGQTEFEDISEMLFRLAQKGLHNIAIDFNSVSNLDHRIVGALLRRAELFRNAGGDIKLAGLSPYLMAVFRSTGADQRFEFFGALETAVDAFERPQAQVS